MVKKDPINMNMNTQLTVQTVKKALDEISEKDKEMELRSRGIVVYKAPETNRVYKEDRKKDDYELIRDLLYQIKCNEIDILSVDRLGTYDEDRMRDNKPRPIKVRFHSKEDRDQVLKNLHHLKYAFGTLRALSIRQDLSLQQRNELNAKLKDAYERTSASPTTVYRVRGGPGNYTLKEFPKDNTFPNSQNGRTIISSF